jgi:hypothetical protein
MNIQGANRILNFGIRKMALRKRLNGALSGEDFQLYSTALYKSLLNKDSLLIVSFFAVA